MEDGYQLTKVLPLPVARTGDLSVPGPFGFVSVGFADADPWKISGEMVAARISDIFACAVILIPKCCLDSLDSCRLFL